jgi:hypothetical protein
MDMNERGGELLCASSSNFESVDGQACDWSFVCLIESLSRARVNGALMRDERQPSLR